MVLGHWRWWGGEMVRWEEVRGGGGWMRLKMFGVRWNNWGWEVVVGFLSFFFLVGGGCFEKGGWIN